MSAGTTVETAETTGARYPAGADPNPQLVRATPRRVEQLAREIADLASNESTVEHFFGQLLVRVTEALAALGGAVWLGDEEAVTQISQIQWDRRFDAEQRSAHHDLLRQIMRSQKPYSVPPAMRIASNDPATVQWVNPSDCLVLLVPVLVAGRSRAVIEVLQRPERGALAEQGYLRFLAQMGEHAEMFLSRLELTRLEDERRWLEKLDRFTTTIHGQLDIRRLAYTIVNESRQLIPGDRVSLLAGEGRGARLMAVSGLDNINRRAEQVKCLGKLAARVLATGEAAWLTTGESTSQPPQIETMWDRYADLSHVRRCAILPLVPGKDAHQSEEAGRSVGALVIEQITSDAGQEEVVRLAQPVVRHSALAVSTTLARQNIFLLPLWQGIGTLIRSIGGRYFWHTVMLVAGLLAAVYSLVAVQTELTIPARGHLRPVQRNHVFAPQDGVVDRVMVRHGEMVESGQVLLTMRNTELDVEITSLAGKLTTSKERVVALQRVLLDDPQLDTEQQSRLAGDLMQWKQTVIDTQHQLDLLHDKRARLVVRATHAGQVITWQVREQLLHRPVQRGQALLSVVKPDGEWELELTAKESHAGFVLAQLERAEGEEVPVRFVLASHPETALQGYIVATDPTTQVSPEGAGELRLRVAVDRRNLPELRNDATVLAHIDCGRRAVGFAWFHDVWHLIQTRVLF